MGGKNATYREGATPAGSSLECADAERSYELQTRLAQPVLNHHHYHHYHHHYFNHGEDSIPLWFSFYTDTTRLAPINNHPAVQQVRPARSELRDERWWTHRSGRVKRPRRLHPQDTSRIHGDKQLFDVVDVKFWFWFSERELREQR